MTSAMRGSGRGRGRRHTEVEADDDDFPPLGIIRRLIRETGLGLIVLGLIVLLFVAYQLLGTNLTEQHNQSRLRQSFDRALAAVPTTVTPTTVTPTTVSPNSVVPTTVSSAPTTTSSGADNPTLGGGRPSTDAAIPSGAAIAHLIIPAIGVDKYVVQGTDESDLSQGPGHYPQTVLPGQIGNAAIAGHRTTYGAPFFRLNNLKAGDSIFITNTSDQRFTYRVSSLKVVSPSDVSVLNPTTNAQLTLTTCNPRFGASSRLIVVAKLQVKRTKAKEPTITAPTVPGATTIPGATTTTPSTTPPTTPPTTTRLAGTGSSGRTAAGSANLGEGDHSARAPAIAYGAAVVLLWILTRLAIHHTRRWRRSLAYLVGIGVCLIPLWFCFENVVRLLPPNI